MNRIEVSVVAFPDGGQWVAQCVEYDIAAHADDLPSLPAALERALIRNVCVNTELGRDGLDGIPAAPAKYRELFDAGDMDVKPRVATKSSAPVRIRGLRVVNNADARN